MTENRKQGPDILDEETALCLSCAACCDGTLFARTFLSRADLQRSQLPPAEIDRFFGKACFQFPCSQLTGTSCNIYDRRPAGCGAFRCRLLKALRDGEITADQAHDEVTQLRQHVRDLSTLLPGVDLGFRDRLRLAEESGDAAQSVSAFHQRIDEWFSSDEGE